MKNLLASAALAAGLFMAEQTMAANLHSPSPIQFTSTVHPFLAKKFSSGATKNASVIVILKSQIDFANVNLTRYPRVQRINIIYQNLVKNSNETQGRLVQYLQAKKANFQRLFITNAIVVHGVNASMLQEISRMPEVGNIVANPSVKFSRPVSFGDGGNPKAARLGENISSIGVARVWNELGVTGQGIVIGGQDTGYQWDHPALKNHYRGWNGSSAVHDYSWHDAIHSQMADNPKASNCGYNAQAPCDDDEHGTHTMGSAVGGDSANAIGVAPGAKWIGCRNMDEGVGSPASYLECFQFFLAPSPVNGNPFTSGRPDLAPHVVTNSWGCDPSEGCTGAEILPALQAMKAAGIVVVAAAGNDGPGCATIKDPPAYHTSFVLSVGAFDHRNGEIADFSSRGPSTFDGGVGPDVVAPGVNIRSSVPGGKYAQANWSGTSMATPHVAGQVALLLSAQPRLIGNVDSVISLIRGTAENTSTKESCGGVPGGRIPNNTYGYGKIRVFDSVKAAMAL